MNYAGFLSRLRDLTSVLLDIKEVVAVGDDRYLKGTRSGVKYPVLLAGEPVITMHGDDHRQWKCELAIVATHQESHASIDAAMNNTYRLAQNFAILLHTPTSLGFTDAHQVGPVTLAPISTSADGAVGWSLSFTLTDYSLACLDLDDLPTPTPPLDREFDNDDDAKANGLAIGEKYYLSENNTYGMPWGMPKKVVEP
jgi:hypothetical protein